MNTLSEQQTKDLSKLYEEHIATYKRITIEKFFELYFYTCPICNKSYDSYKSGFGVNGKGETICLDCFDKTVKTYK